MIRGPMQDFEKVLEVAKRKSVFDQTNSWYSGSSTYLSSLKDEITEVTEEIPKNRTCYLEDELGDVLWNYLNILLSLEKESGIDVNSVLKRAYVKYEQRVSAIEAGGSWAEVKEAQKQILAREQALVERT
ncbi:putative pyrophosphatase [Pseudoalteromonas luteoviolacea 2ta16]|uniref:Putative pyrophosphatase n=2 Tax=Pseudoalteromonas luteoviolacea TaxID=43657 RepID=V4HS19_PSEL2|nr:MazG nucleotide pyrophosphohydrolase domain-containing protein [Pseudoalteromonas luteoviolacea]ESP92578.1 putative pyrophosphatase [Pseudoalteromonas luteoviolacea 2ta16]